MFLKRSAPITKSDYCIFEIAFVFCPTLSGPLQFIGGVYGVIKGVVSDFIVQTDNCICTWHHASFGCGMRKSRRCSRATQPTTSLISHSCTKQCLQDSRARAGQQIWRKDRDDLRLVPN